MSSTCIGQVDFCQMCKTSALSSTCSCGPRSHLTAHLNVNLRMRTHMCSSACLASLAPDQNLYHQQTAAKSGPTEHEINPFEGAQLKRWSRAPLVPPLRLLLHLLLIDRPQSGPTNKSGLLKLVYLTSQAKKVERTNGRKQMSSMLDLLCNILRWLLAITLLRLLSTAFNWEFGISRHYLRLLELMFELGEQRIKRVQSRGWIKAKSSSELKRAQVESDTDEGDDDDEQDWQARASGRQQDSGPPVFLLDQDAGAGQTRTHDFHLDDASLFVLRAVQAIVDDQVTKRFTTEQLKTWNLLTRTNVRNYQFHSRSLGTFWFMGLLIRYTVLLPLRIMFTLAGAIWLTCSMSLVGCLPEWARPRAYKLASLMSFRMLSCGITSRLKFHNRQYRARNGDICVANHTSPLDVVLLACDNCYSLVGQRHGGLIGWLERALSRATNHVWFDRAEGRDRQLVTERLKHHISAGSNLPVLIFPEGTCINNSAVMMFRKGSFETSDRVCPVAIKYDSRFGDPFWNSSKQTYVQYLLLMMSSWAIKCDVWYLPPMNRLPAESSAAFANRVKAEIARQAHLDDLAWDGQLKRMAPKVEWKYQQQEDYANRLCLD